MKREKYENPEMEMISLEQDAEIICTSTDTGDIIEGDGETESPFSLTY